MLKGLYTAAAGMLSANMSVDTLASNLANVSTIGFKGNHVNFKTFPEMLMQKVDELGNKSIGGISTGNQVYESFVNHKAGAVHNTGNTFDLAIQGDGFFTTKSKTGETLYTRAGNFTVDAEGYLSTVDGNRVQGKLGDIQLNMDEGPFQINKAGELTGKGKAIDTIQVTRFTNNQSLQKISDNMYAEGPSSQKIPEANAFSSAGYSVQQGALEDSNINPVMEMVNVIQGQRLYEALQKNIHMHNDTLGKVVNEVGRYK
jgi:flagellar basal-body rod protein FlgF